MSASGAGFMAMITIEVAYARPDTQALLSVQVPLGTTLLEAVARSGIVLQFPEINLQAATLGVFSRIEKKPASYIVQEGDRIEIYRPLLIDPKEARKARAEKAKNKRAL